MLHRLLRRSCLEAAMYVKLVIVLLLITSVWQVESKKSKRSNSEFKELLPESEIDGDLELTELKGVIKPQGEYLREESIAVNCEGYKNVKVLQMSLLWIPGFCDTYQPEKDGDRRCRHAGLTNEFIIDGIWESCLEGGHKEKCAEVAEQDRLFAPEVEENLMRSWKSFIHGVSHNRVWKYAWNYHGACLARENRVPDINTPDDFFIKHGSTKFDELNLLQRLADREIVPSLQNTYELREIREVISAASGSQPIIVCRVNSEGISTLVEVKFCMNNNLEFQNCVDYYETCAERVLLPIIGCHFSDTFDSLRMSILWVPGICELEQDCSDEEIEEVFNIQKTVPICEMRMGEPKSYCGEQNITKQALLNQLQWQTRANLKTNMKKLVHNHSWTDEDVWTTEYQAHGTCVGAKLKPVNTPDKYFSLLLDKFNSLTILDWWKNPPDEIQTRILPSRTTEYDGIDVQQAIDIKVGSRVIIHCEKVDHSVSYLTGVEVCYGATHPLKYIDCPEVTECHTKLIIHPEPSCAGTRGHDAMKLTVQWLPGYCDTLDSEKCDKDVPQEPFNIEKVEKVCLADKENQIRRCDLNIKNKLDERQLISKLPAKTIERLEQCWVEPRVGRVSTERWLDVWNDYGWCLQGKTSGIDSPASFFNWVMNIFEKSELVKPSLKLLNNGSMHKRGRETMDLKRLRDRISGKRRSFVPDVLCKGPKEVPVFTEMQLCFEKTEPFRLKSCSSKELNNRPKSCHENHTLYIPPLDRVCQPQGKLDQLDLVVDWIPGVCSFQGRNKWKEEKACRWKDIRDEFNIRGVFPSCMRGRSKTIKCSKDKVPISKLTLAVNTKQNFRHWESLKVTHQAEALWWDNWMYHGSCIGETIEHINTTEKYFDWLLSKFAKINPLQTLKQNNIIPSDTRQYAADQFQTALQRKSSDRNLILLCQKRKKTTLLVAIVYCFDVSSPTRQPMEVSCKTSPEDFPRDGLVPCPESFLFEPKLPNADEIKVQPTPLPPPIIITEPEPDIITPEPKPIPPAEPDIITQEPRPVPPVEPDIITQEPRPIPPVEPDRITQEPRPVPPVEPDIITQEPRPVPPVEPDIITQEPRPVPPVEPDIITQEPRPIPPVEQDIITPEPILPPEPEEVAGRRPRSIPRPRPEPEPEPELEPGPIPPPGPDPILPPEPDPILPPEPDPILPPEPDPILPPEPDPILPLGPGPIPPPGPVAGRRPRLIPRSGPEPRHRRKEHRM